MSLPPQTGFSPVKRLHCTEGPGLNRGISAGSVGGEEEEEESLGCGLGDLAYFCDPMWRTTGE